ncbi:hypothetical protein BC828DRAFT_393654 [Blastocladiella britannica]|nr:hypothetical protein BC828DRAFT_393654 [Blastocladiella britannica]
MQLFFCVLSGLVLVGGVSTQVILFLPKLTYANQQQQQRDASKDHLNSLGQFVLRGRPKGKTSSVKRVIYSMVQATPSSTVLQRPAWEMLTLQTAVRVVPRGLLGRITALWLPATVQYFRDVDAKRPMLCVLGVSEEGAGRFFDLTLATIGAVHAAASTSASGAGSEQRPVRDGATKATMSGSLAILSATRIIRIDMESGTAILIKFPSAPLFELWSTTLGAQNPRTVSGGGGTGAGGSAFRGSSQGGGGGFGRQSVGLSATVPSGYTVSTRSMAESLSQLPSLPLEQ